ncbi:MAG: hypothetical protein Q7J54_02550 [Candidatus Woesearchaeota archaeon]|nr:hypothetical protein [Candidatus Woesearchaeota archaeon]
MKTKIDRELEKKELRRANELKVLEDYKIRLHAPIAPKKVDEFSFDKDDVKTFQYPIAIGNTIAEKKSDGFCVLLSIDRKCNEKIKMFSSSLNEWDPECFPEITKSMLKLPSGYYHGELLGLPTHEKFTSLDEFIAVENRPKTSVKNLTKELIEKYPLKLDIFDALIIENRPLLSRQLKVRRSILEEVVDGTKNLGLIQQWDITNKESLQQLFLQAISNNYEGLVVKDPASFYIPGSRDSDWIKLKEFLTLDLVVLGFYETPESRKAGKPFSAILVGSYNGETGKYETLAKVKVGAKKDQEEICKRVKNIVNVNGDYEKTVKAHSGIAFNPSMSKIRRKIPERLVIAQGDPVIVEIQVQDVTYTDNWHSCGLSYDNERAHSLRIPTFKQLRKDKTRAKDITTTQQIHEYMYSGLVS